METVPRHDDSQWPVVVITPPAVPMTALAFGMHLESISGYFRRGEVFGMVINALQAPLLTAGQRRMLVELMERESSTHGELCVATAVVTTSAAQRGSLNVLGWLSGRRLNNRAFGTTEQAIDWVRSEVSRAAGISVATPNSKKQDIG